MRKRFGVSANSFGVSAKDAFFENNLGMVC